MNARTTAKSIALSVYQTRAGDHNNLAQPGAAAIGDWFAEQLGVQPQRIGTPAAALNTGWQQELQAARPALQAMTERFDSIFAQGLTPVTALSRCAVSLATLPVLARHRPDACVVWFDAHADLHTPATSSSGYLGGMALSGPLGLWDSGLGGSLASANVILVGARDIDPPEQTLIDTGTVRLIRPQADLAAELQAAIAGRPVYVHLDCDALNPGIVPTEYRHAGGLNLADLQAACTVLAHSEVVGLEISEFQIAWEDGGAPVSPAPLLEALRPLIASWA